MNLVAKSALSPDELQELTHLQTLLIESSDVQFDRRFRDAVRNKRRSLYRRIGALFVVPAACSAPTVIPFRPRAR